MAVCVSGGKGGGGGAAELLWLLVMCRWLDVNVSFYLCFEHGGKLRGPLQVCACAGEGECGG